MSKHTPGPNEADKHLIAAAPDLLKAAKHVVARWDSPAWKSYEPTGVSINLLRAAIAKAEGKEEQP